MKMSRRRSSPYCCFNFWLFFTFLFIVVVRGQKPLFQNPADILQTIKAAGMMDKFEEEMKKMLFKESERKSGESHLNEEFDFYKFIKSYVAENRLQVNDKVMLYLMDLAPGKCDFKSLA